MLEMGLGSSRLGWEKKMGPIVSSSGAVSLFPLFRLAKEKQRPKGRGGTPNGVLDRQPSGQHNEAGRGPRRPVSTIDWRHSLLGLWKKAVGIESDREHSNAIA